jgi:hypothetical protein
MDHKSTGIEYDREAFVPASTQSANARNSMTSMLLTVVAVVAAGGLSYFGYKAVTQPAAASVPANSAMVAKLQQQLAADEERLDRLEQESHRLALGQSMSNNKKSDTPAVADASAAPKAAPATRVIYQVAAAQQQPSQDPAVAQRMNGMQQNLGALKSDAAANKEAWEATTNRLADVVGQVGSQNGQILKSQDQLNALLARTEQKAVSFEIDRSAKPTSVGPVSIQVKSINAKKQRYTMCVYVQESCIELRDRSVYEVVRFVAGRNSVPMEVIATQVSKDGIVGYLEVPRTQAAAQMR